jgi:hypothetical protein
MSTITMSEKITRFEHDFLGEREIENVIIQLLD